MQMNSMISSGELIHFDEYPKNIFLHPRKERENIDKSITSLLIRFESTLDLKLFKQSLQNNYRFCKLWFKILDSQAQICSLDNIS